MRTSLTGSASPPARSQAEHYRRASGIWRGRNDAQARHGLGEQIGELEVCAVGLLHRFPGRSELDRAGDDIRPVQRLAELGGGDVFGFVLRAMIDLPADKLAAWAGAG